MKQRFCVMTAGILLACQSVTTARAEPVHSRQIQVATVLSEVQRGSVDGRDYFTIHIDGAPTGPITCRSTVLKVDSATATDSKKQDSIEAVALSAMLNQEPVMITVPLDPDDCHEGRPTFTDLYLLPASP